MGIPVGNIFAFFSEDDPDAPDCQQVDVYEDFIQGSVEFHFQSGLIIKFEII